MSRFGNVSLPRELVRQASHHLGSYLSLVVPMSRHAASSEDPEAASQSFQKLFLEVASTLGALTEAMHGDDPLRGQLEAQLADMAASPEHQAILAAARPKSGPARPSAEERSLYEFESLHCQDSALHPGFPAHLVEVPRHCADFGSWLLNRFVLVDGKEFVCIAVEYAPLKPPFRRGEKVRIVCADPPPAEETADASPSADPGPAQELP